MVHRHYLENSGREYDTSVEAKLSWVAASLSVRPRGFAGRGWVRLLTFITWAKKLVFCVVGCVGQDCLFWAVLASRMVVEAATGG